MRKYCLLITLNICILNCLSQSNKAIQTFLATPGFENATIGVCIKKISGEELVSHNKKELITPASTMKIITTATALELLGDDYRFKTIILSNTKNPQHIIIRGYGDPTVGSTYMSESPRLFLDTWTTKIKNSIDINLPVEIEVDDSYFGYKGVSDKWIEEDLGNYYAAGAYGISVFDNTYKLYFNTMNSRSTPTILKTEPEMKDIIFTNKLTTNTTGRDNGYINGEPFSNNRKLVGNIPGRRKSFSIKGDIPDPGQYLAETIAKKLTENGVKVARSYTTRINRHNQNIGDLVLADIHYKEIYQQSSVPLKDIIRVINVKSNNHYTEHLIRAIGRADEDIANYTTTDALTTGIIRTKKFWESKNIQVNPLLMYDGCGLAPDNKISPELLCDILLYMQKESLYKTPFLASLPQAGKEGTVQNLLKDTRLEGKIFVKSGSISNVQCFSGYYIDGDNKYAFSVMVNNYNSPRKQVVKAIENLLLSVF